MQISFAFLTSPKQNKVVDTALDHFMHFLPGAHWCKLLLFQNCVIGTVGHSGGKDNYSSESAGNGFALQIATYKIC